MLEVYKGRSCMKRACGPCNLILLKHLTRALHHALSMKSTALSACLEKEKVLKSSCLSRFPPLPSLCLLPLPILSLISKPLHCSAQLKHVHIFLKGWLNLIISLTSSLPSKWSSTELEGFVLEGEPVTGMRGPKTQRGENKWLFSLHPKTNREITLLPLISSEVANTDKQLYNHTCN